MMRVGWRILGIVLLMSFADHVCPGIPPFVTLLHVLAAGLAGELWDIFAKRGKAS